LLNHPLPPSPGPPKSMTPPHPLQRPYSHQCLIPSYCVPCL
jgi:hypothetical protein